MYWLLRWIARMLSTLLARTHLKTRVFTVFEVFVPNPGAKIADSSRIELTLVTQFCRTTPNLLQPLDNCTSSSSKENWVQGYRQEGYDGQVPMLCRPDPRYRLWLARVTAGSGSVAACTSQPAANDMSPPSSADLESSCQTGRPKATKCVQCDYCPNG